MVLGLDTINIKLKGLSRAAYMPSQSVNNLFVALILNVDTSPEMLVLK